MPEGTFPPTLARLLNSQNTFSNREVGVTHPDTPAFIRLTDDGDIQIMANDGLGIIINLTNNSITLMANTIRFMTTDHEGLAWNNNFFNSNATTYTQPMLNPATGANINNLFAGAENFYNPSNTNTTAAADQLPGFTGNPADTNPSQDLSSTTSKVNNIVITPANTNDQQPIR